jgi:ketosteroid isomerase-like protein
MRAVRAPWEEEAMIGQQTQPLEVRYHRLEVAYRWILAVALVALVALAGLVAWTAIDRWGQPDGEQIMLDGMAAWNAGDVAQAEAMYAEDAVVVPSWGGEIRGLDEIKTSIANAKANGMSVEIIGPIVQSGDTVVAPVHMTWTNGEEYYLTSVLTLNADGLVIRHQDYGTPSS